MWKSQSARRRRRPSRSCARCGSRGCRAWRRSGFSMPGPTAWRRCSRARGCRSLIVVDACRSGSRARRDFRGAGREARAEASRPSLNLHDFRWDHALYAGRRIFREDFPVRRHGPADRGGRRSSSGSACRRRFPPPRRRSSNASKRLIRSRQATGEAARDDARLRCHPQARQPLSEPEKSMIVISRDSKRSSCCAATATCDLAGPPRGGRRLSAQTPQRRRRPRRQCARLLSCARNATKRNAILR